MANNFFRLSPYSAKRRIQALRKKNIYLPFAAGLALLLAVLFSCTAVPPPGAAAETAGEDLPRRALPETKPELPKADYVTIIAAGDNLYHDVMIRAGEEGNYEAAYSELRRLTEKADIAFINQETPLGGKEFGFTGFPQFNSPQKLGHAITAAGFDVVNHASNHIMDKGEKAVFATMDFWDTIPQVIVLGIHRSEEDRQRHRIIEKNNITIGFLSYTYGTNNIPLPKDKSYLVSLINTEIMAKEIDALRPLCDFLVVSMHWGEEYRHDYNRSQQTLVRFLAEHRVDLVLGHHPHVIQPLEYLARPDGKNTLCFYSLGNFISAQTEKPTLLGALAYIKIGKINIPDNGESTGGYIVFTDSGAIPLVTHYEKDFTNFKVYPLYAYTDELAAAHRINRTRKEFTLKYLGDLAGKIFGAKEIRNDPFSRPEITPEPDLYQ